MVVGLTKNHGGDVEVVFDKPVQVQGVVELYVLEPSTGGWGLPLPPYLDKLIWRLRNDQCLTALGRHSLPSELSRL